MGEEERGWWGMIGFARGTRARVRGLTPPLVPWKPQTPQSRLSLIPCDPHVGFPASEYHLLYPGPLGPSPLPPPTPIFMPPQSPARAASWH